MILVTGASGNVGSALPGELRDAGHAVRGAYWRADERLTPIARMHRTGEEALESSGLSWTFLRPNFYMQNFLRLMGRSIRQAADVFSRVLGSPVRLRGLADEQAREELLRSGVPASYADTLMEVSRVYRHGGAERVTPTVRDLTGNAPVSFEQFVRDHESVFK